MSNAEINELQMSLCDLPRSAREHLSGIEKKCAELLKRIAFLENGLIIVVDHIDEGAFSDARKSCYAALSPGVDWSKPTLTIIDDAEIMSAMGGGK
jgi:hypothetical protein